MSFQERAGLPKSSGDAAYLFPFSKKEVMYYNIGGLWGGSIY
jgi:hypothetical protein